MSQCFNIVYLAGGFTHALNDVLHERERYVVPDFKVTAPDQKVLARVPSTRDQHWTFDDVSGNSQIFFHER